MKKFLKIACAALAAVCLTGCMKVHVTMDVSKEAEVKGTMEILLNQKLLTGYGQTSLEEALNDMVESAKETYPNAEITTVQEGEGDEAYAGVRAVGAELDNYTIVKEDNVIILTIKAGSIPSDWSDEAGTEVDDGVLKQNGGEITYTVNMPAKASSNAGTVDGKTVKIDMLNLPAGVDTITISCKVPVVNWAVVGGVAVVVLAALFFFLKPKKKA